MLLLRRPCRCPATSKSLPLVATVEAPVSTPPHPPWAKRPWPSPEGSAHNGVMASYTVNDKAVARARRMIDAHQYVLESSWGDVQPSAADENAYLESHSWEEYGEWFLGLTDGAADETKARHGFVYGDFRRLHRMGLVACQYRAAEWRHKEIELAAHELLQYLDRKSAR